MYFVYLDGEKPDVTELTFEVLFLTGWVLIKMATIR